MTENKQYWDKAKRPPLSALKTIKGGRLSGMSNISPQWRWQVMTEMFGPVGFGWKYTVEKIWTSPGANEEHFAFASILLYYKTENGWSEPIPGEGGSKLVSKESGGLHNNDEAFKMAVTDALGTAMAKLGVAADIYLGNFDGSKYNEPATFPKQVNSKKDAIKATSKPEESPEPTGNEIDPDITFPAVEETQKLSASYTAVELRKQPNVLEIKQLSGKTIPEVMTAINSIPDGEKRSIGQIVQALQQLGE